MLISYSQIDDNYGTWIISLWAWKKKSGIIVIPLAAMLQKSDGYYMYFLLFIPRQNLFIFFTNTVSKDKALSLIYVCIIL